LRLAETSRPEGGLGLFEAAAEPHRADARRKPGRRIGFDGDAAQRRRPRSRLEAADVEMRRTKRCSGSSLAMPITES
jgi:hypothetical protein